LNLRAIAILAPAFLSVILRRELLHDHHVNALQNSLNGVGFEPGLPRTLQRAGVSSPNI
jgi:hypothetical protein